MYLPLFSQKNENDPKLNFGNKCQTSLKIKVFKVGLFIQQKRIDIDLFYTCYTYAFCIWICMYVYSCYLAYICIYYYNDNHNVFVFFYLYYI